MHSLVSWSPAAAARGSGPTVAAPTAARTAWPTIRSSYPDSHPAWARWDDLLHAHEGRLSTLQQCPSRESDGMFMAQRTVDQRDSHPLALREERTDSALTLKKGNLSSSCLQIWQVETKGTRWPALHRRAGKRRRTDPAPCDGAIQQPLRLPLGKAAPRKEWRKEGGPLTWRYGSSSPSIRCRLRRLVTALGHRFL